jgi:RecJ-like exonuclease
MSSNNNIYIRNNGSFCHQCNGRGKMQVIGNFPCNKCAGTGREYTHGVGLDPFFPCGYCRGTGKVTETRYQHCRYCNGRGKK